MAKARILIVEDECIIAKEIGGRLKHLGYAVSATVSSGEEAIKKAEEMRPDLVLMDIRLQGDMDGVDAAAQMRDRFDIPVVYLTAYTDEDTLRRAKVTEPFGYIIKPFQERELHGTIEMALYKHKMEKKLKEHGRWCAAILKSIDNGVIAADANGLVKFINPVAQALTGLERGRVLGKHVTELFYILDDKTRDPIENPAARALRESVSVGRKDYILITRDGREVSINDSTSLITDDRGNIIGVVLTFSDITERKQMEEKLLKAQKLESLGILAGGIAHDFNNLLTGILGNVTLAKLSQKLEPEVFQLLNEAKEATLQAQNLTKQLLTFSRGGVPVRKTTSISKLLRDTVTFSLRGSNVRGEFSIPDDLWPAEADEGQIRQVINNLIINATQAMPAGGTTLVRAKNMIVEEGHGLPLRTGKYIQIAIEDHGAGIPEEHLRKIFDPYFSTKEKGQGLGLAVTHSIVKKHDGYIDVESQLGVGTTFYVYLPASTAQVVQGTDKKFENRLDGGRILVMDDEEIVRNVVVEILKHFGYEVEFAGDGAEAIELYKKAKEAGSPFDAVILDLTVPGRMGGKEAIKRLLEIDPEVKAIVSSGYSNDPILAEFRKYGFRGVLEKPYRIEELKETLHEVIIG